jgi:hypothetical protein
MLQNQWQSNVDSNTAQLQNMLHTYEGIWHVAFVEYVSIIR